MSACCCSPSACSWEPVEIRSRNNFTGDTTNGDVTHLVAQVELITGKDAEDRTRMDIALLREQYKWTKEKQKRQTSIVLFRQASEESSSSLIGPSSPVSVVSVKQDSTTNRTRKQSRDAIGSPVTSDPLTHLTPAHLVSNPWHTHLSVHRQTRTENNNNNNSGDVTVKARLPTTTAGSTDCSSLLEDSVSQKPSGERELPLPNGASVHGSNEGSALGSTTTSSNAGSTSDPDEEMVEEGTCLPGLENHHQAQTRTSCSSPVPGGLGRKFSAPASMLTRQLSFGGGPRPAWSSHSQDQHYPFPQRKPPRKSELARRLGLYSSF